MTVERLAKDTLSVTNLDWNGESFAEPTAHQMWLELPEPLRKLAISELILGNVAWNILRNSEQGIVLLAFRLPPRSPQELGPDIRVHYSFDHGNYCYDGTKCTYEHLPSGSFLAFDDPEWKDEP